jgi:hypothetical protein
MIIDNKKIRIGGGFIKTAKLRDDWYGVIEDPESFIKALRQEGIKADIFTFWQKLPETEPKYGYYMEPNDLAAIPIESYDHWFKKQIGHGERKSVRKAEKTGVIVKVVKFGDELVQGITDIFNETPIRQGRPYSHYGEDFETVKSELSKTLEKCDFIGAFYGNELIGFIQLGYAGASAIPFGMVAKIKHRDKSPQTALIAKAIAICDEKKIPYLLYGAWLSGSIGDYKQRIGCIKISVPRYYIPLSIKGKIALKLNLHKGFANLIPEKAIDYLKDLRKKWYTKINYNTHKDSNNE